MYMEEFHSDHRKLKNLELSCMDMLENFKNSVEMTLEVTHSFASMTVQEFHKDRLYKSKLFS